MGNILVFNHFVCNIEFVSICPCASAMFCCVCSTFIAYFTLFFVLNTSQIR